MGEILTKSIIEEVEQSFLDYSLSVITDRAIPSAEDGVKPVARRILYDMHNKGYFSNKKFVKCAQPVGDTMGRFHPHGDSSIYGALVWLSQPWNMRYPLIEFHGNNGSRDGDGPAAYRYTECRLSKAGEEMLRDLKKDTSDWIPAYTDEENEPVYLPGGIPNLLVNGTSGIAVGMACSFAPHNLNEIMDAAIYTLKNPECEVKELLQFVQGPDFPTGGIVINKDELPSAYLTGKGRARIRAEYVIETEKNKDKIVFTSIPYKVSKEKLQVDIDKLCEENKIEGITSIRDESSKDGVRFVIELGKGVSSEPVISKLFKFTQLEETYSFNQVALVDKKPKVLNLKQLIEIYNNHQIDVLLRKTKYDANRVSDKIHILEGLLIALEDIDNVIALIKKSESSSIAKISLMAKYNLSEIQAKAILDMRLSKLAKLEKIEIQKEKDSLVIELDRLNNILSNPIPILIQYFIELKEKFGDERRSKIIQVAITPEEKEIEFVTPEKCVVVMTEGGTIKRISSSNFKPQKRNGKGVKTQEDITSTIVRTNTIDSLMIFSNKGRMYRLLVNDIPEGTNSSKGQSIKSLIAMDIDEQPVTMYSIYRDTDAKFVLFVTKNGIVKKTSLDEYTKTKKKSGISAINIKDGDSLATVSLINKEQLILITAKGNAIRFESTDILPSSRITIGVKGINISEEDYVVAALPIRNINDQLAIFSKNGMGKKVKIDEFPIQKKAGKGLICYKPTLTSGEVVAAALIDDNDNILLVGNKNSLCISAKEIPLLGRNSIGNQLIKDNALSSVSKT